MTNAASRDMLQATRRRVSSGRLPSPRSPYWLRWATRLGPRGFIAYAAFNTLVLFVIRIWLIPA